VIPIRLYLLYCTLYFLSLTCSGYRAPATLSFATFCVFLNCHSVHAKCYNFYTFFCIDFTLKSAITISFLLDRDSVNTSVSFYFLTPYHFSFFFLICFQLAAVLSAAHTTLGRFICPYCPNKNPQVFNPIFLFFFLCVSDSKGRCKWCRY
jgi:hypothetical protein